MRSLLLDGLGQLDISDLRCRVPEKSEVNADLQIASCKAKRALQHMEGNDRSTKRLKLSLEPDIGHTAVDIKDNGQEIYKSEPSPSEKLMQNVDRIWFERGDWRDISEKSLEQSIENGSQEAESVDAEETEAPATHPEFDIMKLRESVVNKLFYAKSEIDVALDVINILLAQNRSSSPDKEHVLPLSAGSLQATYVAKLRPTLKAQLESAQLTLGLKRKQQKAASEYLKASAASLRKMVQEEQGFWQDALELRRNNWLMQAGVVSTMTTAGSATSFLVRYGYTDSGSEFNEAPIGELGRSDDEARASLVLPHAISRKLVTSVTKSRMGRIGTNRDASEVIMGMGNDNDTKEQSPIEPISLCSSGKNNILTRLADARATVFDSELYAAVLSEAQTLANDNDIRFTDDGVIVTVDGQIDLTIQREEKQDDPDHIPKTGSQNWSTSQIAGRMLDLSLRLLLLQRHRLNIWKSRAKLLCPNRKTQLLLASMEKPSQISQNVQPTSMSNRLQRIQQPALSVSPSRKQPSPIPILSPTLSYCKFWVLFDRVRHLIYKYVDPFTGEGGVNMAVHYQMHGPPRSTNQQKDICSHYPGFGDMAISLNISIMKGQFLVFWLHQSGDITVRLPQGLVTLINISEFQALLTREINLICLRMVCDAANDIIKRSHSFKAATASEQARSLWKVDDIEETINGSIWWALGGENSARVWRSIHVQLLQTSTKDGRPAYHLQFQLRSSTLSSGHPSLPSITRNILLAKSLGEDSTSSGVLTFSDKVKKMVKELVQEAATSGQPAAK